MSDWSSDVCSSDLLDAQAKTQRNNGPLQYLLGGKLQARLEYRPHTYGIAYGYTQQYSKYRPANYRHPAPQHHGENDNHNSQRKPIERASCGARICQYV